MHDLIRDMGREIVRAECAMEPEKRSRLWHHEDVTNVLRDKSVSAFPNPNKKCYVECM